MKQKKRQKLCHNCEGDIDLDVIVCPYCAADLREEKLEELRRSEPSSSMLQMSHSLYPPPYPIREERPEQPSAPPATKTVHLPQIEEEPSERLFSVLAPIVLFSLGTMLFVLGLLLMLFSHDGQVVLKWDGRLWFLYLFAAVPFLVFGYRSISKL